MAIKAATAHIKVVIERLPVVNRQLADAKLQLDQLSKKLAESIAGDDAERAGAGTRASRRDDP